MGKKTEDILLASFGTGIATRKIEYKDAKGWGALGWVRPILSVVFDGTADATDYQLRQILPGVGAEAEQRYFRFDTNLDIALDDLDAASSSNIMALMQEGAEIIEEQHQELNVLMDKLTA